MKSGVEQERQIIVEEKDVDADADADTDDGSWESLDSDEDSEESMEGTPTITACIMNFFKQHYKDH